MDLTLIIIILCFIYAISIIVTTVEVVMFYSSGHHPSFKDHLYNTAIVLTPIVNTIASVIIVIDIYKNGWNRDYE